METGTFGRTVLFGASGGIGRLFAAMLTAQVDSLHCYDTAATQGCGFGDVLNLSDSIRDLLRGADLVVLAVPDSIVPAAVASVSAVLSAGALVVETGSSKKHGTRLSIGSNVEVLSINPLFGPDLGFAGNSVVLVGENFGERSLTFEKLLHTSGASTIRLTEAEHSRSVTALQALTHLVAACMAQRILRVRATAAAVTPLVDVALAIGSRTLAGKHSVYFAIAAQNEDVETIVEDFIEDLSAMLDIVRRNSLAEYSAYRSGIAAMFGAEIDIYQAMASRALGALHASPQTSGR